MRDTPAMLRELNLASAQAWPGAGPGSGCAPNEHPHLPVTYVQTPDSMPGALRKVRVRPCQHPSVSYREPDRQ